MEEVSFARGVPAPELLPVDEIAACTRAVVERESATLLSYGSPSGYEPLRRLLAERHSVEPDRVLLTNGSLQALALVTVHALAGGCRRVLVEAPTYDRPLRLLARLGAELAPVPLDEEGLDPDAVESELAHGPAAFLYTIPTFQNPTGATLSLARRIRLADLARRNRLLVVEDDPYGAVRLEGEPVPTIFELLEGDGVVYCSSYSKTVAPGLRVGYVVVPPELASPLSELAAWTYVSPVTLTQAVVYELERRGLVEPALRRMRGLLLARRDAMLASLDKRFAGAARWTRPQGGYFLWLELPAEDARQLLVEAAAAGVSFVPGADFYAAAGRADTLRLAYSLASPLAIEVGIDRLAALLRRRRRGRSLLREAG